METFEIAKIIKPQGIKGDIKVQLFVSDFDYSNKTVFIEGKPVKIEKSYNVGGGVALKLDCINSRNEAENFRNKIICVDKNSIEVPKGKFLVADLVDKQVCLTDGKELGKIVEVLNFGSADVFLIKSVVPKHFIMASHKQGLIVSVEDSKIIFDEKIYGEVAVDYED
ncbi:MAG: 16S rRNA processing protein RimM [Clostridia bacterium]|nr:16S rRNA processing protein RimM [Clostridia bacterium]